MNETVELAVIGAGPAGIEAALAAAGAGVEVVLIDSSFHPGGQYYKQLPDKFNSSDLDLPAKARQLFHRLKTSSIHVLEETVVWGAFTGSHPDEWILALHGPTAPTRLKAKTLILATGAYDRSIPFPGWDLPGVITAGATQIFVKNQRVLPGRRFILSGTGPLQLAAAAQLVRAGTEVTAILECTTGLPWRGIPYLPVVWGQWARLQEGFDYMKTLVAAGVPYRTGQAVIEARGDGKVEEAVTARLDKYGRPVAGSEQTVAVDTIVVGYGLLPSTELCRLLDCEMEFAPERGGFTPQRDEEMQTSRPGVYAAGDGAGIGGAEMSMIEGRIAGWSAARRLGHLDDDIARRKMAAESAALKREQRFARMLGCLFAPPPGLYALANDDTILCRCEQVTLRQIRETVKYGVQTVIDVKNITRSGMGNCQGRTCGSIVAQILAAESSRSLEQVHYYNVRPPIHPLPLHVIENTGEEPA